MLQQPVTCRHSEGWSTWFLVPIGGCLAHAPCALTSARSERSWRSRRHAPKRRTGAAHVGVARNCGGIALACMRTKVRFPTQRTAIPMRQLKETAVGQSQCYIVMSPCLETTLHCECRFPFRYLRTNSLRLATLCFGCHGVHRLSSLERDAQS